MLSTCTNPRPRLPVIDARHLLIVRLSAFGDVLHVLPALAALRQCAPRARIAWVVEEMSASILEGHPDLDQVWRLPRKTWQRRLRTPARIPLVCRETIAFFKALRCARVDVALDFQANLRGALVARLSGARVTIGFDRSNAKEYSHRLHALTVPAVLPGVHRAERNLAAVRFLGYEGPLPAPRLPAFAGARAWARGLLEGAPRPLILLHPGVSRFGAFKAWTETGFASLAARVHRELGAQVLVTWGPGEKDLAARIAGAAGPPAAPAPPCPSLRHLAGMIAQADVLVAPDTGVMHLADALGVRVVALFGPKAPAVYGPRFAPHRVVRSAVPCSPCDRRRCADPVCMRTITVDMAFDAVSELLGAVIHGAR